MTTFGPYELEVSLGRGGMGQVHRAYDTRRDRVVAVKVLLADLADDADFRARFARECRTVARLREPHIIPIHDFGEIDGRLFLDMRLVDGFDLGTQLAEGPLSPYEAVDVVRQVAAALDAAHQAGLVHRDVKPGNVLLSDTGTDQRVGFAYLVDFGIARSDVRTSSGHSTAGLVGTVAYMAPERIAGEADDARADVYSLACVLYECLAGRPPFEGDTYQVLYRQVNSAPPRLDVLTDGAIPAALADVLDRGLAKDPADRYPTAGSLAAAARVALASRAGEERTTPGPATPGPAVAAAAPALRDRYRFVRDLGRGGMGTVWLARDEHLSRLVAVKRMLPDVAADPESVRRIMREAEMAARLHHPNSVMVLDRIVEDGVPHVVMEYVRGRTLATLVAERGSLDVETTAEIGLQVAAALAEAHRLGIAHRDVKPANVLVTDAGVAKLADFGVARATDDPGSTASGHMTGTIAYMAPEVASGATGSPESDMWSFGALLYTCTEGHAPLSRPGQSSSATAMLLRLVNERVPPPVRSGPLTPLLLRLLDIDPAGRPSPQQVRRALAEIAGVHPLPVTDPADPWPAPDPEVDAASEPADVTMLDVPSFASNRTPRSAVAAPPAPSVPTPAEPTPTPSAATPSVPTSSLPTPSVPTSSPSSPPAAPPTPPSDSEPATKPEPAPRPRRRRWVALGTAAAVVVAAVVALTGFGVIPFGATGSNAAAPGASSSPSSSASTATGKCKVGTGPDAPRGCGLTDDERALGARIPTRFGLSTCQSETATVTVPGVVAGVDCEVADPNAPAEQVEAVSFDSDAALAAYLTTNRLSFDFPALPAGTCGVNAATDVGGPWKLGSSSGTMYCATNDVGYAVLAWTYAAEKIVLMAVTTPNHTATTVDALVRWVWSGSLTLG